MGNITDLTTSWEGYTKYDVEDIIKQEFSRDKASIALKFGASYFDQDKMMQYFFATYDDKQQWLDSGDDSLIVHSVPFNFSGTVNQIKVINEMASANLFFTTQSTEAKITCSFISQEKGITDSAWTDVNEDFEVSVMVDRGGSGSFVTIVDKQSVLNGNSFTFDVRNSLATGANRVRVMVKGVQTESTASLTYTVTLTTMYLAPSNFAWYVPFVEGEAYSLGGMNIGGNLQKVLRIRVSREEAYLKEYEINIGDSIYTSTAYVFTGLEFPTAGSGVYNVELWLDANGLTSEHLSYNIICVKAEEKSTAQLVSVSDMPSSVLNFSENKLFEYCVYNKGLSTGSPTISLDTIVNTNKTNLKTETLVDVPTNRAISYSASLELEVVEAKMQLSATIDFGNAQQVIYHIDNSKSYPATSEAVLYINPAQRSNVQGNKDKIVNAINSIEYDAEWTGFSWGTTDGWVADKGGRMCLRVPAFSRVNIAHQPMADLRTPITMEFVYKVENASDYDDPVIYIGDIFTNQGSLEEEYDYDIPMINGGYIAPNNTGLGTNDAYSYSKPIFLAKGESIHFNTTGHGFVAVTETNESGSTYSSIIEITSSQTGDNALTYVSNIDYVAERDIWIRISRKTANITTPILYIKRVVAESNQTLNPKFTGIRITPKNICVHSRDLKDSSLQDYNTIDEQILDVIVTIVPNYKTNYGNLAQVYCNGVKVRSFEFTSIGEWNVTNNIILGSDTADLSLYKMRVYHKGFDKTDAMRNFINSLPDLASREAMYNRLLSVTDDSYNLSYDSCVRNGYNTMVIEMLGGKDIPSLLNQESGLLCNLQINIHNFIEGELDEEMADLLSGVLMESQGIEGQGTTAMTYGRWNFRWKLSSAYGKRRITAKKNVASSMQSHKMGATRMFNYLHRQCVGANEANANVAVLQYPVYGFQKVLQDDGVTYMYRPIGLYTIGADKGDKHTFGYDQDEFAETLIHLEGSDHTPKSVGFDYPWKMTKYSSAKDVEAMGAVVQDGIVGAWEVGAAGEYETDSASDEANIQDMLNNEFKPAYDIAYNNSPYILCVEESLEEINANIKEWKEKKADDGYTYEAYEFFNKSTYNVIYLNKLTDRYEESGINLLSDLNIAESEVSSMSLEDTTAYIVNARKERFVRDWETYWHKDDAIFHYVFMLIFGATDNFKKNTYPYKFRSLADGGKWRWRADDLDTIFDINNQGFASKAYSILVGDKTLDNEDVYRGENSAFWTLVRLTQKSAIKAMVHKVFDAMVAHPKAEGSNTLEKLVGCVKYIFWDFAQAYFPPSAYNADTEWTYEDTWVAGMYTGDVTPLKQALGGHYEAEQDWVAMRMLFLASYYNYGEFTASGYNDQTSGTLAYSGASAFTYNITPAIDFNPTIIRGSTETITYGGRIKANTSANLTVSNTSGADTRVYVKGLDWIKDLGDLSSLTVSASKELSVESLRLQRLKIGDVDASKIPAAGTIKALQKIDCPSMMLIDARNLSTLEGTIDLSSLDRLREAYFGGTNIKGVNLQDGSKIKVLELPASITSLKLVGLKNVSLNIEYLSNVSDLRIENCEGVDGFELMKEAYFRDSSQLSSIRLIGFEREADANDLTMLANMVNDVNALKEPHTFTGIDAEGRVTDHPVIEGTLIINTPIYREDEEVLKNAYGDALIIVANNGYYIRFEDDAVREICATNWGDGTGITEAEAEAVTDIKRLFINNMSITSFNELRYFIGLTQIGDFNNYDAPNNYNAFRGCENLESIILPQTVTTIGHYSFGNCYKLSMSLPQSITTLGAGSFAKMGRDSNTGFVVNLPNLQTLNRRTVSALANTDYTFVNSGVTRVESLGYIRQIGSDGYSEAGLVFAMFSHCEKLEYVSIDKLVHTGKYLFYRCPALKEIHCNSLISIGDYAVLGCQNLVVFDAPLLEEIGVSTFTECGLKIAEFPHLKSIGVGAFRKSNIESVIDLGQITTLPYGYIWVETGIQEAVGVFRGSTMLKECILPETLTDIGAYSFFGCEALEVIILMSSTPPTLGASALANTPIGAGAGSIYVPDASVTRYREASGWADYAGIIFPISEQGVVREYENITSNYTLEIGQAYGKVGGTIQFTDDTAYEHTKALIGDVSYVLVKAPSEASSLVQYVDANDKILKIAVTNYPSSLTRYNIENVEGATHIYITSAIGTLQIWKEIES